MESAEEIEQVISLPQENEEWLQEIMELYGEKLSKLAYSYVRDWGKAQEIIQDIFVLCYEGYEQYHTITYFKPWIYRMTINKCKDSLRTSWVKRVMVNSNFFSTQKSITKTPEEYSIQQEDYSILINAVFSLPIKYREVILLHYYEELSVKELAEIINRNENTVKTRLKRAREMIKNKVKGVF